MADGTNETELPRRGAWRGLVWTWVRLLLAVAVTLGGLPYFWGRVLIGTFLLGVRGEARFLLACAVLIPLVIALTWNLRHKLGRPGARWPDWIEPAVYLAWVAEGAAIIAVALITQQIPYAIVVLLFTASTCWVPLLAWCGFAPARWRSRLILVALGLAGIPVLPLLTKVQSMMGDTQLELTWCWNTTDKVDPTIQPVVAAVAKSAFPEVVPTDFPQFMGPARTGVLPERNLSFDWKARPPAKVWDIPVGLGWSGFACVGAFCMTQEQNGADELVVCRRVADGSLVWRHIDEARFDSSMGGSGPRATPTINNGKVFAVGGTGLLNCLDAATGQKLWSVNINDDNGGHNISHGVCGSPVCFQDLVIVCPTGTKTAALVAYDSETGKKRWSAGQARASYASPVIFEIAGRETLLVQDTGGLSAHEPASGKHLWNFDWTNSEQIAGSQPLRISPDQVFISIGYGAGSVLLNVGNPRADVFDITPVWKSRGLKTKFTTAMRVGQQIYGLDDGILACIDLQDGRQLWKGGRYGHGQLVLVGDKLIIQCERGDIALVQAHPRQLKELARIPALGGKTWNNPALAGNRLLIRNDQQAICFQLNEAPTEN